MSHEWKFGDWGQRHIGDLVVRFVSRIFDRNEGRVYTYFVLQDGHVMHFDNVEYMPDCTGFDWKPPKPIEPPEGYRLLVEGDTVLASDLWLNRNGDWVQFHRDAVTIGEPFGLSNTPIARKVEPTYRPFANAAEFKPFRDKWVRAKLGKCAGGFDGYAAKIDCYLDRGVSAVRGESTVVESWKHAFDVLEFEDGTPFGIATTEKESTCAK